MRKQSTDILMVVNVYSPDESLSPEFISNYTSINVADVLARVDGVAEARSLGALDYGMRIWLDPDRMAAIGLTVEDVVAAIREQNVEVAAGQIGGAPVPEGQQFQYTLIAQGRLDSVEQFENIIIKRRGIGFEIKLVDMFHWGRPSARTIRADVREMLRRLGHSVIEAASEQPASEVAIARKLEHDLYVVFAGVNEAGDKAVVQAYINPLVQWVWIGGVVMILGTFVGMLPGLKSRRQEVA